MTATLVITLVDAATTEEIASFEGRQAPDVGESMFYVEQGPSAAPRTYRVVRRSWGVTEYTHKFVQYVTLDVEESVPNV